MTNPMLAKSVPERGGLVVGTGSDLGLERLVGLHWNTKAVPRRLAGAAQEELPGAGWDARD
jgi:hypothetical protein